MTVIICQSRIKRIIYFFEERAEKKIFKMHVKDAWETCLPIWRKYGRVEDWPRGVLYNMYMPSKAKQYGLKFASSFCNEHLFIINQFEKGDNITKLICFDLLTFIFHKHKKEIPKNMMTFKGEIPDEISLYHISDPEAFNDIKSNKIVDLLIFELENDLLKF